MAKTRRCKNCKTKNEKFIVIGINAFCDNDYKCASEFGRKKADIDECKALKKKHTKQKKDFKRSDLKTRKEAAKTACHAYIRKRDDGLPCICCGRVINGAVHAGHFLESGNNPLIRYDEDNIHAQSGYCNTYKGGDSDDYPGRLRIKIGDERVDLLLSKKGGTIKRTADDYIEIETYYKDKIKQLNIAWG